MKASELTIHDWMCITYFDKPLNAQVTEIEKHSDGHCVICGEIIYAFGDEDFQPIPLTEEILKANGFVKINTQKWELGEYGTDYYINVNPKKQIAHINGVKNNVNLYDKLFVHELQHALRLCGLSEMADNFKLE